MQRVAIITGASRGIGRACAIKFAKEGIRVIANYNKSGEKAESLKEELAKERNRYWYIQSRCDKKRRNKGNDRIYFK